MSDPKASWDELEEKMLTKALALDFELSFIAPECDDLRIAKMKEVLINVFLDGAIYAKNKRD